jgi:hypothetical protein
MFLLKLNFIITDNGDKCVFDSSKYTKNLTIRNENIFLMKNFKSFSELNFSACNHVIYMSIWYIIPSEKLMLDDKLDFFVMSNNRRLKIKTTSKLTYIQIANIKGFDLRQTFSPFRYIEFVDILTIKDFNKIYWTMSELNFDFYIENDIIEKNNCNQSLINEYNYFTGLYLIVI